MEEGTRRSQVTWSVAVSLLWPLFAIGAWHLFLGRAGQWTNTVVQILGAAMLIAAPGMLAVAAAEDSARWRRATGAAVGLVTLVVVIAYGWAAVSPLVACQHVDRAGVASTMLVVGVTAGIASGITAWQGGRLVSALRWRGIGLAFVLGWAMLAVVIASIVFRALATGCYGY